MRRYLYETFHPDIYHGFGKKPPFFEGWYFKLVDATEQHRYAIIPGIFLAEDESKNHSFVQVLNGTTGEATYHPFPADAFQAHPEKFDVRLAKNRFQGDQLTLNLQDHLLNIAGTLHFENRAPFPVSLLAPGIMGWYGYIPFMECYHGVVSLDHTLRGSLTINGQSIDFTHGRGYIEKDWGQNFPSGYVWQQSNHFDTPGTSLTASIAMIPFLGTTFPGFIIAFWHQGLLYRLATYTGAVTETLTIDDECVFWVVKDHQYRLEMTSQRTAGGLLHAPIRTDMHKRVDETMRSTIQVRFTHSDGKVIFEGEGRNAGLEVHGDLAGLITT